MSLTCRTACHSSLQRFPRTSDPIYCHLSLEMSFSFFREVGEYGFDGWLLEVSGRLSNIIDLKAADVVLHNDCNIGFRLWKKYMKL